MMQPSGAASPFASAPATVCGVPLEPGERVVWIRDYGEPRSSTTVLRIVFGLLFAIAVIGLVLLYMAFFPKKFHVRAHVVTNRRLLCIAADGTAKQVRWGELKRVTVFHRRGIKQSLGLGAFNVVYSDELHAIVDAGAAGAEARPGVAHPP